MPRQSNLILSPNPIVIVPRRTKKKQIMFQDKNKKYKQDLMKLQKQQIKDEIMIRKLNLLRRIS